MLTETAAYVDMQDAAGRSVLYLAAQRGYSRCVEVLLAQGASCLLNDNRLMWTPVHVAGAMPPAAHFHTGGRFLGGSGRGLMPFAPSVPGSAANGHSECLHMMFAYGEEGDLTNVADKHGQ